MRAVLSAAGVIVALGLVAISATLSFLFCRSLGSTMEEGLAYGTAAAGLDILKALAPFYLIQRWRNGQLLASASAALVWTVAVVVSLSSAFGLAAQNRLGKSGAHEGLQAQYRDTQYQLKEAEQRLAALQHARPAREVDAALQAILARPITTPKRIRTVATASENCTRPDRLTAEACIEAGQLRTELARAQERAQLENRIGSLRQHVDELRHQGAGEGSEPDRQAGVIMRTINAAMGTTTTITAVQTALIALIAIALEVGSSCGLYAALGSHVPLDVKTTTETTPNIEARPSTRETGKIADYCHARVTERQGARVAMGQAFEDYGEWCTAENLRPAAKQRFMRSGGAVGIHPASRPPRRQRPAQLSAARQDHPCQARSLWGALDTKPLIYHNRVSMTRRRASLVKD